VFVGTSGKWNKWFKKSNDEAEKVVDVSASSAKVGCGVSGYEFEQHKVG